MRRASLRIALSVILAFCLALPSSISASTALGTTANSAAAAKLEQQSFARSSHHTDVLRFSSSTQTDHPSPNKAKYAPVATCGAAGPLVAGLAVAGFTASTALAANDVVGVITGTDPLHGALTALTGSETAATNIRMGIDVATMLTPGSGATKAATAGAKAASHADEVAQVGSKLLGQTGSATKATTTATKAAGTTGSATKATTTATKTTSSAAKSTETASEAAETVNPLANTQYTKKVQQQMSSGDIYHGFPSTIDTFGSSGTTRTIVGGDGIPRTELSIPGSVNGRDGSYRYIIEPDNTINHRLFEPN